MLFQLHDVSFNCTPTFDLTDIIRATPSRIVAAIPLKPAARIIGVNPPSLTPDRQRLRCIHSEVVERSQTSMRRELRALEPTRWKLLLAISQVFSAKHSQLKHLFRRKFRLEFRTESATDRFRAPINIARLHSIIYFHANCFHRLWASLQPANNSTICVTKWIR